MNDRVKHALLLKWDLVGVILQAINVDEKCVSNIYFLERPQTSKRRPTRRIDSTKYLLVLRTGRKEKVL